MKISFLDRLQAIKNSEDYRKDYRRYEKQREKDGDFDEKLGPPWDPHNHRSKAGRWLCEKWGLSYPVAPDAPLEPFHERKMSSADLEAWMIDGPVYPVSFLTEHEIKKPTQIAEFDGQKVVTHYSGKLCLLIDTNYPSDMIMDVLREFINHYVKENKGRIKNTEEDPWKIYELYQQGKNLLEISRELSGVSGQPAYDPDADKFYRRVERAYKKALKIIVCVEKEAKERNHPPKNPNKVK